MTKQGISDSDHAALIAGAYKFPKRELGLIDNTEMGALAITDASSEMSEVTALAEAEIAAKFQLTPV